MKNNLRTWEHFPNSFSKFHENLQFLWPDFFSISFGSSKLQTRIKNPIFDWYVKVSKIDGCQLVRQADMEFDFYVGSRQYHVSITVGTETMVIGGGVSESS